MLKMGSLKDDRSKIGEVTRSNKDIVSVFKDKKKGEKRRRGGSKGTCSSYKLHEYQDYLHTWSP